MGFMGEVSVDRCGIYGGGFGGQMWDLWGRFRWTDVGFMGEVSVDRCGIYGGGFGGQMRRKRSDSAVT